MSFNLFFTHFMQEYCSSLSNITFGTSVILNDSKFQTFGKKEGNTVSEKLKTWERLTDIKASLIILLYDYQEGLIKATQRNDSQSMDFYKRYSEDLKVQIAFLDQHRAEYE